MASSGRGGVLPSGRDVAVVPARWREHPAMHVYHYAAYETGALKRLTARHGVREFELDHGAVAIASITRLGHGSFTFVCKRR